MWLKIQRFIERRTNGYKKKQYLELLSEFDHPHVTLEHLPVMLVAFWNQFDVSVLDSITGSEWMYTPAKLNHNNVAELIYSIQEFTNAIAQDDYTIIEHAAKERFKTLILTDMDAYLSGINGEVLDPKLAFKAIKENLYRHGEIIENIQQLAYRRLLHRFYSDIQNLTTILVNNIKV